MSDYDPQQDAIGSYYAAVEAKRERGDTHWPERRGRTALDELIDMSDRRAQIAARIRANVQIVLAGYATPCWLWTMADSGNGRGGGYPRIKLNSRTCAAHIVSFVNFYGYVPGNKQIDHKCRNRRCVNPDHLEMVTPKRNAIRREEANGRRRARRKAKARKAVPA